ncbi:hypothetical protein [Phreatobacter stygius]|uniref:hypothetical protein n=1 Tax=Phreatobacter stygius TaxID=1940610 RepID=UPI0014777C34|nr:hypothetical protein [Phreatobacter stygius]
MTSTRIVMFFMVILVLINPPMVLGLFGTEGRRVGVAIEDGLGTASLRIAMWGRR